MFNVGNIITGTESNHYNRTNSCSLMYVSKVNTEHNIMDVRIIASVDYDLLNTEYLVDIDNSMFKTITYKEWESSVRTKGYDNIHIVTNFEELINEEIPPVAPSDFELFAPTEPFILSDKEREKLKEEIISIYEEYDHDWRSHGIEKIIRTWEENKGPLIQAFKNHPNYNGKYQIVFDQDYDRKLDYDAIGDFANWLNEVKEKKIPEYKYGAHYYYELHMYLTNLVKLLNVFNNNNNKIKTINGKTEKEFEEEYNFFKEIYDTYQNKENAREIYSVSYYYNNSIHSNKYYTRENYLLYKQLDQLISVCFSGYISSSTVDYNLEQHLNSYFPEAKIKEGMKVSRAFNKILTMIGVPKLCQKEYNQEFAKFSDAVNPLKITRHTVLSVHPIDYLTMSFGNSWSSCHTIDKKNKRHSQGDHYSGMHCSGTLSYLLDETSMVFYTVNGKYNGNKLELQDKINRCMFHYYDEQLVQGRVYPQDCDSGEDGLYTNIRNIVQKIMADIYQVPNLWTLKKGTSVCESVIQTKGTHYPDYVYRDNCNVSTLKSGKQFRSRIVVGHNPICAICGYEHTCDDYLNCC